jgi:membrane-associated HD superfamily phosphohydrolase
VRNWRRFQQCTEPRAANTLGSMILSSFLLSEFVVAPLASVFEDLFEIRQRTRIVRLAKPEDCILSNRRIGIRLRHV